MTRSREFFAAVLLVLSLIAGHVGAADRFYISIPGPTLSYVPLYYGHEKGFFTQEGLDLQVLVVRGIIGVSSLMSGRNRCDLSCRERFFGGPTRRAGQNHLRHTGAASTRADR
jgi:hypothetical protein